jgi:hypothetical protein
VRTEDVKSKSQYFGLSWLFVDVGTWWFEFRWWASEVRAAGIHLILSLGTLTGSIIECLPHVFQWNPGIQ